MPPSAGRQPLFRRMDMQSIPISHANTHTHCTLPIRIEGEPEGTKFSHFRPIGNLDKFEALSIIFSPCCMFARYIHVTFNSTPYFVLIFGVFSTFFSIHPHAAQPNLSFRLLDSMDFPSIGTHSFCRFRSTKAKHHPSVYVYATCLFG